AASRPATGRNHRRRPRRRNSLIVGHVAAREFELGPAKADSRSAGYGIVAKLFLKLLFATEIRTVYAAAKFPRALKETMSEIQQQEFIEMTADLVSAYVTNNP